MRAQRQIASLLESGAETVLDARVASPARAVPGADEEAVIRAELARLVKAMYPHGNAAASKLGKFLEKLAEPVHAA